MALVGDRQLAGGAAPFPYPISPGPAGHEQPQQGPPIQYGGGGGFAGSPEQSATAATLAGMPNNSPAWVAAQTAANANGGVLPVPGSAPGASASTNPFDSDPGYAAALADENQGIPTIKGTLNNQIAQRLQMWGDPSFAAQAGFGVDPQAAAFARQNYLTGNAELARLDHSHALARQAIINRLAGHGLLFSGDTGYLTGQEDQNYGNQVYDAQQKVLGDLYGYQNSALSQEQALHAAKIAALEHAFDNAANHPGLYGNGSAPPNDLANWANSFDYKKAVSGPGNTIVSPTGVTPASVRASMLKLLGQKRVA